MERAVIVEATAPDPDSLVSRSRPFFAVVHEGSSPSPLQAVAQSTETGTAGSNLTDNNSKPQGQRLSVAAASGVLLSPQIIVTTATLFTLFSTAQRATQSDDQTSFEHVPLSHDSVSVRVCLDTHALSIGSDEERDQRKRYRWVDATIVVPAMSIRHPVPFSLELAGMGQTLRGILGDLSHWRVNWHVQSNGNPSLSRAAGDLARIVVLKLAEPVAVSPLVASRTVQTGESLTVIGTPFGLLSPQLMMNSVAKGIVSNILCSRDSKAAALVLTDAPVFAGMEGGLAVSAAGDMVGMVLPPLCRTDGYPIELSFIAPFSAILETCSEWLGDAHIDSAVTNFFLHASPCSSPLFGPGATVARKSMHSTTALCRLFDRLRRQVVVVAAADQWSTGIIITHRHVLTNAHAVRPMINASPTEQNTVRARLQIGPQQWWWVVCKIVVVSSSHMDVCLLELPPLNARLMAASNFMLCASLRPSSHPVLQRDSCLVVGFPLFEPHNDIGPSCSFGNVRKICSVDSVRLPTARSRDVLLQTSATVHVGNSGGIVSDLAGDLIGLCVCNVRQVSGGQVLPRINFAIPASILYPLVRATRKAWSDAGSMASTMPLVIAAKGKGSETFWKAVELWLSDNADNSRSEQLWSMAANTFEVDDEAELLLASARSRM